VAGLIAGLFSSGRYGVFSRRALIRSSFCVVSVLIPACTAPSESEPPAGPPLAVQPFMLSNGAVGASYNQTLTTDGEPPQSWRIAGGELPPGLALSAREGVIAGTPSSPGTFSFAVAVDDSSRERRHGEITYALTVIPQLELSPTLPPARVDVAYSGTPTVTGGVTPYHFQIMGLPGGMTFDPDTGTISGTPLNAYPALPLDITVTDSGDPQQTASGTATLVVKARQVAILTTQLNPGKAGVPYQQALVAVDGRPPYTWAVTFGWLGDLSLNLGTGVISGTPKAAQTITVVIKVTDSDTPPTTDSRQFTITVAP
jgi:hypothetical protein